MDIRKSVLDKVEWCALVLDVPMPELDYTATEDLMGLKVWALADKKDNVVLLNEELLTRMPDRVDEVVYHEMAHLACPVHGHGKAWVEIFDRLMA